MINNQIIKEAKLGNNRAIEKLLLSEEDKLFHLILKMTMDFEDAKDILQETFLLAIKYLDRFKEESQFSTWIYRIAVNKTLNYLKRKKRERNIVINDCCRKMYDIKGLDNDIISFELYKKMQEAIYELPEKYRLPFIMANMENTSYSNIATILKIKKNTVKTRVFRARNMLKDALKGYLNEM